MRGIKDLRYQRFGRLTVIAFHGMNNRGNAVWECICKCGNKVNVLGTSLVSGNTKSCGCLNKERLSKKVKTHGLSGSRIYVTYLNMKSRCNNPKNINYKYYGGKGVKIYEPWNESFEEFYDWALSNGYEENLTIERIDVAKDYEPGNCRWASFKEQANNKSNSRFITIDGETKTVQQWADYVGTNMKTISWRINHGWDEVAAVFTPAKSKKNR